MDFEESQIQGRIVTKPNIDPQLDELKVFYEQLPEYLVLIFVLIIKSGVANEIVMSNEIPTDLALTVTYFPQLGFLIALRNEEIPQDLNLLNLGLEYQVSSAYFSLRPTKQHSTKTIV